MAPPEHEWWATASRSSLESEFKECQSNGGPERFKQGRAAIFEALGDSKLKENFDPANFDDFKTKLEEITSQTADGRFLIVLEDLGREWVESLGSILKIPVYFFALHWALPINHLTRAIQLPAGQSPEQHFILPYQQVLPFRITRGDLQDNQVFLDSISVRNVSVGGGGSFGDTCDQLVSYWGKRFGPNNWIAVILVDPIPIEPSPPPSFMFLDSTMPLVMKKTYDVLWTAPRADLDKSKRFWKRSSGGKTPVVLDSRDRVMTSSRDQLDASVQLSTQVGIMSSALGTTSAIRTEMGDLACTEDIDLPIFDQLLKLKVDELVTGNTPLHATSYIQRVVLAHAVSLVRRSTFETDKLTLEAAQDAKRIGEFKMQDVLESGWSGEWKGKFYTRIWELRENLQQSIYMLKEAEKTIKRINMITTWRQKQDATPQQLQQDAAIFEYGIEKNACDAWEWENVESTANFALQMLDRTRDTYVEAVGATAAKLANDQAISSRKISGYAAVFVPASITAAVLAIPSFSQDADATRFWIFWVVSVPLAIFAWIWFMTSLPAWLAQTQKDLRDPRLRSWKDKVQYLRELSRATLGRKITADTIPSSLVMERSGGGKLRATA